jgi:hypothetical protein
MALAQPAVAAVDVRGAAPGTHDTDLLEPHRTVEHIDAGVLSGGSVFGLDAASGVAGEFGCPQSIPEGEQDRGRIPVAMAVVLAARLHQPLDLPLGYRVIRVWAIPSPMGARRPRNTKHGTRAFANTPTFAGRDV